LGEFPLLLSLVNKKTIIVAIEKEQDYLDLAANCASVPANLSYATHFDFEEIDTFDSVVLMKSEDDLIKKIEERKIEKYVIHE
jgi:hypothetical protein